MKSLLLTGIAVSGLLITHGFAQSLQFPLTVRDLTLTESQSCPGGYGGYGQITSVGKSDQTLKLPSAKSKHPLIGSTQTYGTTGGTPMKFLLDESEGTGKGYDRFIADINGNGDLTDDPVYKHSEESPYPSSPSFQMAYFGPVKLPADRAQGQWQPTFIVRAYLYNLEMLNQANAGVQNPVGQLQLWTANLLEAEVAVNGAKQRLAIKDANCNFRIGDPAQGSSVRRSATGGMSFYLQPGDSFLRDWQMANNSAGIQADEAFSSILYFDGKPYAVELAPDLTSIQFTPYTEALGTLEVTPEVRRLVLGWSDEDGQFQALTPQFKNGKAEVPPGTYKAASCVIGAGATDKNGVGASSSQFPEKALMVQAGRTSLFECGAPLELKVTTEVIDQDPRNQGVLGGIRSLFGTTSSGSKQKALNMNVVVGGAGGETYDRFYRTSQGSQLPPPSFEVVSASGKSLAKGNFEYG